MGQRLVITINDGNKPKMKVYYHWSGYTDSTFEELNNLWHAIKPLKKAGKSTEEILLGIIRYLEGNVDEEHLKWLQKTYPDYKRSCHGGIGFFNKKDTPLSNEKLPNEELAYIQSLYPGETFDTNPDRNNGLVYMSKDGMDDVQSWAEGNASIDLDTETFSHDINWCYHGKDEFIADLAYERNGEIDPDTQAELATEYDSLNVYNGDGSELFGGKCDDIEKKWTEWHRLTGSDNSFRDSTGTVWEGLA